MHHLSDCSLFKTQCFTNGVWHDAGADRRMSVDNPATCERLGTVPYCGEAETLAAIETAHAAWPAWRELTAKDRAQYLHDWHRLIQEHKDDLARIMTLEQGKPLTESLAEIEQNAAHIIWCAEECRRLYGETIPAPRKGVRPLTFYQPVGVVFAITPWNFPVGMILRKVAPALATGCPIIVKPASATPFSALALAELGQRAGIPPGVFSVITGDASAMGVAMGNDARVRKITFTGSTEVGKRLAALAAPTLKRVSLELGGNAPFIVFDDADPEAAAAGCVAGKFRNAGQACIGINRILVQHTVKEAFLKAFMKKVRALSVGNGLDPGVDIGPLIDKQAVGTVDNMVSDALKQGAELQCGGHALELGPCFYPPTVLTGVHSGMRLFAEEQFGPVAAITFFETEDEALALANATPYGLASYVYSRDVGRVWRMVERLNFGMVGVNDCGISVAEVPFGGIKESGLGREGGRNALQEFVDVRYALFGGITG